MTEAKPNSSPHPADRKSNPNTWKMKLNQVFSLDLSSSNHKQHLFGFSEEVEHELRGNIALPLSHHVSYVADTIVRPIDIHAMEEHAVDFAIQYKYPDPGAKTNELIDDYRYERIRALYEGTIILFDNDLLTTEQKTSIFVHRILYDWKHPETPEGEYFRNIFFRDMDGWLTRLFTADTRGDLFAEFLSHTYKPEDSQHTEQTVYLAYQLLSASMLKPYVHAISTRDYFRILRRGFNAANADREYSEILIRTVRAYATYRKIFERATPDSLLSDVIKLARADTRDTFDGPYRKELLCEEIMSPISWPEFHTQTDRTRFIGQIIEGFGDHVDLVTLSNIIMKQPGYPRDDLTMSRVIDQFVRRTAYTKDLSILIDSKVYHLELTLFGYQAEINAIYAMHTGWHTPAPIKRTIEKHLGSIALANVQKLRAFALQHGGLPVALADHMSDWMSLLVRMGIPWHYEYMAS